MTPRRLLPVVICMFIASLIWLAISTCTRTNARDVATTAPQAATGTGIKSEDLSPEMPAGMDFVGTWRIESRWTEGHELSGERLQIVRDYGFDSFIVLNLDATAELNLYDNPFTGTWMVISDTEATVTTDEMHEPLRLEDGKLIMGDERDYIVFMRCTPEEYAAFLANDEGAATIAEALPTEPDYESDEGDTPSEPDERGAIPMNVVIADDGIAAIKVTGKATDNIGCSGYYLSITNKSDQDFTVTRTADSFTVNGTNANPVLIENLEPGQTVEVFMWWETNDVPSMDALANVEGTLEVDEVNGFDTYATYEFKVN
ncbi:MAG: hypothetical protein IKE22_10835 [Atopobiaceae bacterium]|nr:hypothetical protein [Atopobiaceae bacterium]